MFRSDGNFEKQAGTGGCLRGPGRRAAVPPGQALEFLMQKKLKALRLCTRESPTGVGRCFASPRIFAVLALGEFSDESPLGLGFRGSPCS